VYTGPAVHRAARICAAARGGQVLVSQATQTIIEDEEEEPGFHAGRPTGAAGHLKEGLALAAEAGDQTSAAYYLEALGRGGQPAGQPAACGAPARSRRLAPGNQGSGWLHAVVPRVPHDDAVLAALRSRLGDAAFKKAQAWGATAGSTRARQYALE
jgi:hypothetical protein